MQTIHLKVNVKANKKLLSLDKNDLKKRNNLFTGGTDFEKTKKYLHDELIEIESGIAVFYSLEEANFQLEEIIESKDNY